MEGKKVDIEEFKRQREEMEEKLQSSIAMIVEDFKQATGMTPYHIDIEMIDISTIGSATKKFAIGNVITKIDL